MLSCAEFLAEFGDYLEGAASPEPSGLSPTVTHLRSRQIRWSLLLRM